MDGRMRSVDAKAKYTWGRGANVTNKEYPNPFTVPLGTFTLRVAVAQTV